MCLSYVFNCPATTGLYAYWHTLSVHDALPVYNATDTCAKLKPREEWRVADKDWLVEQLRKALVNLPGIEPSFTQPIEMRISEMLTGARGDLAIKIFGPDLKELSRIAGQIQRSEAHTSELQSLMPISYAVLRLKNKTTQ